MQTLVAEVLAAWRRAERLSNDLPPGSIEQLAALAACDRLRQIYHDLTSSGVPHELTESEARNLSQELTSAEA
jgi:hypothetical protein